MDNPGTEKKVVRVTIFQQPYALRTSGDPAETEALAQAVDTLMNQIAMRTSGADAARVAVLACLHLADQVRQLERGQARLRERLEKLERRLAEAMDGAGTVG
ncbi:MAG: cell division protein ZapA [Bryobacteraceae bacterium]|nr:cell division protein ZapA [Bryobacteraceae bacterium]